MKAKRFFFRAPTIFGTPLKYGAPVFIGFTVLISGLDAHGGDILRGGRPASNKPGRAGNGAPTPAATDAARANARDTLARTNKTLKSIRAMQAAARQAALANGKNHLGNNPLNPTIKLPVVPNGLGAGGLQVSGTVTTDPTQWTGAKLPVQQVKKNGKTTVTIQQTEQQALLNWETFNVGKKTTVTFDQSKGGADVGKWIAFNKITDPSGNPTQILGNIKADGQVYLINTNGIIFGGGSQVNARGLTASSLPINTNLIGKGLLNNPDAQFLFSGLEVPGGSDGTPKFVPDALPEGGVYGDVTVQAGAVLKSPAGSGGNGGRIMLVGPNVTNDGTISTESGQTILAAGLQVGVAAHDGKDPSLRGLDVWVGAVGEGNGTATNSGIIEVMTGSTLMAGRHVNQLGAIESSTSVNLNGRIDLIASYGAVANPNFDSTSDQGSGGPIFFNQFTGVVTMGEGSSTRILPDYGSKDAVPGIALPERSQVNIEGLAIHFEKGSTLFAPNGEVSVRAGVWPYKDADGSRTIFDAEGKVETGITNFYSGAEQKFLFEGGQIHVDEDATISVAGSVDVFVPLAQSILKVELRGSELADSPLVRDTSLRGVTLTVDIRNTGIYNGKYWIGTPLGDVTGLAGLIKRNAAQLTAVGGDINLRSGGSIGVGKGATLDVSGGYFNHEGGLVKTSYLMSNGRLVDIKDATPDQVYDGAFSGESTFISEKWGVVDTFETPLFPGTMEKGFIEGAAGGTLSMTAPGMAIDGELRGLTVKGPRQRDTPPGSGTLRLNFESEKALQIPNSTVVNFIRTSPTPPAITFSNEVIEVATPGFSLVGDTPAVLPSDRLASVILSPELLGEEGFGALEISNPDGSITVPKEVTLSASPKGSISFAAANISILGAIDAAGGKLSFTTYNISPSFAAEYNILNSPGSMPLPTPVAGRGYFRLESGASLSTAGMVVDDRVDPDGANVIDGGAVSINSYHALLAKGSEVDVSGGVNVNESAKIVYGKGGTLSVVSGTDPGFAGVIGGTVSLGGSLNGHSGSTGGTLNIQAGVIHVGGERQEGALNLAENFFRNGGFSKYSLTGIGAASSEPAPAGQFESYTPAISIAPGATIRPVAEGFLAEENADGKIVLKTVLKEGGLRAPVSLGFTALGSDDLFTIDQLEVRGDIVMGKGASIVTDPGASVSFKGGTVTLHGSVIARGGAISVAGAGNFPLTASQRLSIKQALPTVHLGKNARLSVAGTTLLKPDLFGRRIGTVFSGGKIFLSGNILAENGSLLDASGTSGILDLDPASLAGTGSIATGGPASAPVGIRSIATRIDSNGGVITLAGSQMLLSDAELRGAAGGSTATGGQLVVSSGKFYEESGARTSADINLLVSQSGNVITNPDASMGVGIALFDQTGAAYGNSGSFALDRFSEGDFASLSLGGNVEFQGEINLDVPGALRLAAGGVIHANDTVNIKASYVYVGQDFRAPEHPDDVFVPFDKSPGTPTSDHFFAPTHGAGRLNLDAKLIDVGTLSLQNIGSADLTALGGDIRGNGTLGIAGDLTLTAAQIYPTTLGKFDIFAYDHDGGQGSVTIRSSGTAAAPLSAGGSLSIYSSNIIQGGVLRASLGSIRLGWDGTDLDPSDADIDAPYDAIAGLTISVPVASRVTLEDGSLTSVSGKGLQIPFGISPDGLTWIDPRGVNVTLSDLPEKAVFISGDAVKMEAGSTVDISGGGDLLASRWVSGNGGSRNLLGEAGAGWAAGSEYQPGDLVSYNGETWSARLRHSGQTPGSNLYWTKIEASFAIVPDFNPSFSPYGAFNTGSNAGLLEGNPGLIGSGLKVGDRITLEASDGLPAGTYTLLPRGYANLKGAFLVTPVSTTGNLTVKTTDGASHVSGYLSNAFNQPGEVTSVRSRFEIASAAVVKNRATYEIYSANEFISKAGGGQLLPTDAGYAAFHGNSALLLQGDLLTESAGRGAMVDISSFSGILLTGGHDAGAEGSQVTLDTGVLGSWGADSLLIGGVRTRDAEGTHVDVRTNGLTLDNSGEVLSGPEIILVSNETLEIAAGSSLESSGKLTGAAETLLIEGDGTLLRVSSDPAAGILRNGLTESAAPLLTVAASANISGNSVILDSTYGTILSSEASIDAKNLTLGSGQISVVFDDATGTLQGSVVDPHLTLSGVTLRNVSKSEALTLQSYRSIDFYGTGTLGGSALESITLSGNGVRGYQKGAGEVVIRANDVHFTNPVAVAGSAAPAVESGRLSIDAGTIHLGSNQIGVSGYGTVSLAASEKIVFESDGGFSTTGNLKVNTPTITGARGTTYGIHASKAVTLAGSDTVSPISGELGASLTIEGSSIAANSNIHLPSGQLTLRATDGPLEIGGDLSVAGSFRRFDDLIRYSDAGTITLESLTGDVKVLSGADVTVSASDAGGNAGTLIVRASQGVFSNSGSLHGHAGPAELGGAGVTSGRFLLDVGSLDTSGAASFGRISQSLDDGGFHAARNFRIRNGDVSIDGFHRSHGFSLSTDRGSILVNGTINAFGQTGGSISLAAHGDLTLASGAVLNAGAVHFDSAGKGGSILLEAGTQLNGVANNGALLDLQSGSQILLGVNDYVAGDYKTPGSSAFEGKFTGTMHLRAPRTDTNDDVRVDAIESGIFGASSVVVEGFKVYTPPEGVLNIAQRNLIHADSIAFLGTAGVGNANETAMQTRLLTGAADPTALQSLMVLAPGVEMVNLTGDLTLGLSNNSSTGTTNVEALAAADWDLSGFRYGSRGAAGVLTLRASGDLVFNNTLSDGFTPVAQGAASVFTDNGHSLMWLGRLMTIKDTLPTNTQSWSYRLTAGADMASSDFRNVLPQDVLDGSQPGKGSVIVGEFYPTVPNTTSSGSGAAIGSLGQTADTIRISTTQTNRGNRFEVVRTGTGDITINAGRDVQLRNQFSTIYTAGVALPDPTTIYSESDFVRPVLPTSVSNHPGQSPQGDSTTLGAIQQLYPATWSLGGGNITLQAQANIGRYTLLEGVLTPDSTRQMPTNWLYRRGYVDPATGLFASDGGFGDSPTSQNANNINDKATSTTWWIDYSNFFQGIGALGGGNVDLVAGNDVVNVDAVTPTNARMPGRVRNPDFNVIPDAPEFLNVAPDAGKLVELGGGDVTVLAGRHIDGGVYYVERGEGRLFAGGGITTNASRSPLPNSLDGSPQTDPLAWLPTTLFVGKSHFDVAARGDVLLGPVTNPFLMPQGLNNKYWYKTHFSTFSPDAGADVISYGGNVTHRSEVTLPTGNASQPLLELWYGQNLFKGADSEFNASQYQPWIRLSDLDLGTFKGVFGLTVPNLRSTAMGGNLNIAGDWTLAPSSTGDLELASAGSIIGLQMTGPGVEKGSQVQVWTSSTINISDAAPSSIPGITSPLAYQSLVGRSRNDALLSLVDVFQNVTLALTETGSYLGTAATSAVKQALHGPDLLHAGDRNPVRLSASGGDITGLTLFSPKETKIIADRDITDVAFYLQNISARDISLVSAGRDIIPFTETAGVRATAGDITLGNFIGGSGLATAAGNVTNAMAGDIQINGPGVLEVLGGRDLDLGIGANFTDGTGVGITSIGNSRNPNLPFDGADIIALAGVTGPGGISAAGGLADSSLFINEFIKKYIDADKTVSSPYLRKLGIRRKFSALTEEQQAIVALEQFYKFLRKAGDESIKGGNYRSGYEAIHRLFGKDKPDGEILTRAREIRTTTGGAISLGVPGGGITMASEIFGNPLTPPGIVTEYGGAISTFTNGDVNIGQARIFTLRGGDITMWSSNGDIAAGTSPKTVVTAPPTRVVIDITSADIQTDLGGLATGGGIGVLAAVEDVEPGNVSLIAPRGFVDAGDAGIQATGNLTIAAQVVLNSGNISAGGTSTGTTPAGTTAPSVATVTAAASSSAAAGATVNQAPPEPKPAEVPVEESLSLITVDVIGYGDGGTDDEEEGDTQP
ncbi:MAG: filamentous hemagglutinin family protein [Verrucomicrobiota bacterium]